jgi:hypothetical protein
MGFKEKKEVLPFVRFLLYNRNYMNEFEEENMKKLLQVLLVLVVALTLVFMAPVKTSAKSRKATLISDASTYSSDDHVYVGVGGTVTVTGDQEDGDTSIWSTDSPNVTVTSNGQSASVTGVITGEATIRQSFYINTVPNMPSNANYLNESALALNYGDLTLNRNDQVALKANKNVVFTSSNDQVARVDTLGNLTATGYGAAVITAKSENESISLNVQVGEVEAYNDVSVTITQPVVAASVLRAIPIDYLIDYLPVTNVSQDSLKKAYVYSDDNSVVYYPDGEIKYTKKTHTTLHIYIDGLHLTSDLTITKPGFTSLRKTVMKKGQSTTFKCTGTNTVPIVTPKASTKLSFVNNKVKALKYGKLDVSVNVDETSINREYWCVNAKTYKVIRSAFKYYDQKLHYSQKRRNAKKYVDCSSYVWRLYKNAGIKLVAKSYTPTAAGEAKWLSKRKRLSSPTKTRIKNLKPGDLLFYSSKKNGRYKNITHVEIYISSGVSLGASGPYYKNAGGCVAEGTAVNSTLVAIGRVL